MNASNKALAALKYLLLLLVALLAACIALLFAMPNMGVDTDNQLGIALGAVLVLVIAGLPLMAFGVAFLVEDICLFAARNKRAATAAVLVTLCLFAPVTAVASLLYGSVAVQMPLLLAPMIAQFAVFVACFVLSCVAVHKQRTSREDEE